ncbi:MAG: TetR family transcriptional regulator, partial [Blautia sp.]|nr:TetR family transcriptional regulator [Blautia sp.]
MEEKKGGKGKAAERTKRWIAHAMKKLLEKKPLDKVHVTEICQLAEVERPTFYYYFKDKYDLMAWIFFQSAYNTDIISVDSAAESMDKMRDEYVFYKRAYEDNSQNAMWTY